MSKVIICFGLLFLSGCAVVCPECYEFTRRGSSRGGGSGPSDNYDPGPPPSYNCYSYEGGYSRCNPSGYAADGTRPPSYNCYTTAGYTRCNPR